MRTILVVFVALLTLESTPAIAQVLKQAPEVNLRSAVIIPFQVGRRKAGRKCRRVVRFGAAEGGFVFRRSRPVGQRRPPPPPPVISSPLSPWRLQRPEP